jgi:ABC-type lipoprotein release transport system permease subunit
MGLLMRIAWRNVGRNRLRSAVVIASIAVGLWAAVFSMGVFKGMSDQRTRGAIRTYVSHLQIHHPEFRNEQDPGLVVEDPGAVQAAVASTPGLVGQTSRMILNAMATSPKAAAGVRVEGIVPEDERTVTDISERIVDGDYFATPRRLPIVIGRKLSEKLGLHVGSKLVLTFQDTDDELTAGAFRIVGIFRTASSTYDESVVFVDREDLARLYGKSVVHEVAVLLDDIRSAPAVRDELAAALPDLAVETWAQVAPDLGYADSVLDQSLYVFVGVILLGMAFGIVNSMLMAVLERRHELGMLLSIGMSRFRIFAMIVWETIFIALVGGPAGLVLAAASFAWFGTHGVDLSVVGQGLASIGMDTVIYPKLDLVYYVQITAMVVAAALGSAVYPALRAIRYRPAEATRTL